MIAVGTQGFVTNLSNSSALIVFLPYLLEATWKLLIVLKEAYLFQCTGQAARREVSSSDCGVGPAQLGNGEELSWQAPLLSVAADR